MKTRMFARLVATASMLIFVSFANLALAGGGVGFQFQSGAINVGIEKDASADSGCFGVSKPDCDTYSVKIPFTFNTSGDLASDVLNGQGFSIEIINGNCTSGTIIYNQSSSNAAFTAHQKGNAITSGLKGTFSAEGNDGFGDLPVSIYIKLDKVKGTGTLEIKGPTDLRTISTGGAALGFGIGETPSDIDGDSGCGTLTVKTHPQG